MSRPWLWFAVLAMVPLGVRSCMLWPEQVVPRAKATTLSTRLTYLAGDLVGRYDLIRPEDARCIRGVVKAAPGLRPDATAQLSVRAHFGPLDHAFDAQILEFDDLVELASIPTRAGTRWRVARPVGATAMAWRAQGPNAHTFTRLFAVGRGGDPGERPNRCTLRPGARVTLTLELPAEVTDGEKRALVGRTLWIEGSTFGYSMCQFGPRRKSRWRASIRPDLTAVIEGVPPTQWTIDQYEWSASGPLIETPVLAPFVVDPGHAFEVDAAASDVAVPVPLKRGRRCEGQVTRPDGSPAERVRVFVRHKGTRSERLMPFSALTDGDGYFSVTTYDLEVTRFDFLECTDAIGTELRVSPR
ncbi:MAG: carboxypeptidase-like regulatory domain-containing protein [Planctomycetota bacterium]